jgi:hypothetical protein
MIKFDDVSKFLKNKWCGIIALLGILSYGFFDLLSTYYSISEVGSISNETSDLGRWAYINYGNAGFIIFKLVFVSFIVSIVYLFYRKFKWAYFVGVIYIGIIVFGIFVSISNLIVSQGNPRLSFLGFYGDQAFMVCLGISALIGFILQWVYGVLKK